MLPLLILGAVAVAAVVLLLTFAVVKKWFQQHNSLKNPEEVNVLLKERLKSGSFKTVSGVFNTRTEQISATTAWESKNLDEDLTKRDRVSVVRLLE